MLTLHGVSFGGTGLVEELEAGGGAEVGGLDSFGSESTQTTFLSGVTSTDRGGAGPLRGFGGVGGSSW